MTKLRTENDAHQQPQQLQQQQQQQQQQRHQQSKPNDSVRPHQIYVIFHRQLKKRVRDGTGKHGRINSQCNKYSLADG